MVKIAAPGFPAARPLRAASLRWAGRGMWAVMDQGLFATSNFAVGILLARWLSPPEYGAFTLAFSLFLLFGTLHTALLTEPMLVFGSSKFSGGFSTYLRVLVRGHCWLTGLGSLAFAAGGVALWLFGSPVLARSILGIAVAAPLILLAWLARRACFACLQPHLAVTGGGIYFALMLAGTFLLYRTNALSSFSALLLLGGCSLVSALWLLRILHASTSQDDSGSSTKIVLREHWSYGRWALASSALSWAAGNTYFFVLPLFGGLGATAAFKALSNLVLPILQANIALSTLLLPTLVRVRGQPRFRTVLLLGFACFIGGSVVYWVFLGVFSEAVIKLLYDGQYLEHAHLLWIIGIVPILSGIGAVLSNALRALERPDQVFWAYLGSAVSTLSLGLWAAIRWGVGGAAFGSVFAMLVMAGILSFLAGRRMIWSDHA